MKNYMTAIALLASASLPAASLYALTASDFEGIGRDVNIMSSILEEAFRHDMPESRGIRIESNYLARQGAVFTVSTPRAMFGGHEDPVFVFSREMSGDAPIVPDMAEITDEINIALEGLGETFDFVAPRAPLPPKARLGLFEASRELRQAERELREVELQLLNASREEREQIEEKITALTSEIEEHEKKQAAMEKELEEKVREAEAKRTEARQKLKEEHEAQLAKVESALMQSLCDYGSTLKKLPNGEHISVVIEPGSRSDKRRIYVFDKNEVTGCRSDGEDLKAKALTYLF